MATRRTLDAVARYLNMIGIEHVPIHSVPGTSPRVSSHVSFAPAKKESALGQLREHIGDCTRCRLCEERKNIVFGVGSHDARIMFIGEGPGVDEDARGEPFVGAAGKRLNLWIFKLGLKREEVYIANIVKCRPPGNRTPRPDEAATCLPFLKSQIAIVNPKLIVTLGGPALNYLLERNERITRVRGTRFDYSGISLIATYHPAYILRNPPREKEVFLDLDSIMELMKEES